jgi:2-polyprenyl-3-methyl-5-hydroxy-6-metoxy-1,4-benzoquinol methylase
MNSGGMIGSRPEISPVDESGLLSGKVSDASAREWPAGGLESVPDCPVCGSREREVLYADLQDRVFFCAPGRWTLRHCLDCGSAYLDPRPTAETIGLAYRNYLTHLTSHSVLNASGLRAWIRRALGNGYRNHRFGTKDQPATALGIVVALLFPSLRAIANSAMRNLPRLPVTGRRLLDVGCGNGEFLYRASSVGWETVGVDVDAAAVATSRSLGLDVRLGGVDVLDPAREQFDGITLSHVIEHVHDPQGVLRSCHRLLKPGGWVWLDTPNLNSCGHAVFEHAWRGLEPPRHLVLFTRDSLCRALISAGFTSIEDQPYRQLCKHLFAASEAIAANRNPWSDVLLTRVARQQAREAERVARTTPSVREFVTVKAWKTAP